MLLNFIIDIFLGICLFILCSVFIVFDVILLFV